MAPHEFFIRYAFNLGSQPTRVSPWSLFYSFSTAQSKEQNLRVATLIQCQAGSAAAFTSQLSIDQHVLTAEDHDVLQQIMRQGNTALYRVLFCLCVHIQLARAQGSQANLQAQLPSLQTSSQFEIQQTSNSVMGARSDAHQPTHMLRPPQKQELTTQLPPGHKVILDGGQNLQGRAPAQERGFQDQAPLVRSIRAGDPWSQNRATAKLLDNLFISLITRNETANVTVPKPEPVKTKTYDLNFNITENINEIFTFSRNTKALAKVAPITLTYNEYIRSFKPIMQRLSEDEKRFRTQVYLENRQLINENNIKVKRQYNMGLNLFTDIQLSEFYKKYNKVVIPDDIAKESLLEEAKLKNENGTVVLKSPPRIIIDWSCKASFVVSQGTCGASYVISPLQSIVVTLKMYNQTAIFLSIQEVLSCGLNPNTSNETACESSYFTGTYDYVQKFGVGQSSIYFYDDKAKFQNIISECNRSIVSNKLYLKTKVFIQGSKRIKYGDCEEVIKQLRFRALSVAVAGNGMQFYSEGTYQTEDRYINHGVTLVGYHPEKGYLIKNSWGRTWGLLGFGYLSESTGVCSYAMYPTVPKEIGAPELCSRQV